MDDTQEPSVDELATAVLAQLVQLCGKTVESFVDEVIASPVIREKLPSNRIAFVLIMADKAGNRAYGSNVTSEAVVSLVKEVCLTLMVESETKGRTPT